MRTPAPPIGDLVLGPRSRISARWPAACSKRGGRMICWRPPRPAHAALVKMAVMSSASRIRARLFRGMALPKQRSFEPFEPFGPFGSFESFCTERPERTGTSRTDRNVPNGPERPERSERAERSERSLNRLPKFNFGIFLEGVAHHPVGLEDEHIALLTIDGL